ncbi:MAG: metallophosphoesterase [Candidatus Bathyarchaeota archaeon]|nr:MAG: metallophosphoesterase [Candidatus Bathyarchaeota archaeon]
MTPLFGKKESTAKILFATDMHGSEGVWRKFLNASSMVKADVAISGGDLTGKMIVPVVETKDGKYSYYFLGENHLVDSSGLEKALKDIRGIGYYAYLTDEKRVDSMRKDSLKVDEVFMEVMQSTLKNWLNLIQEKVPRETQVIVCPGNDDRFPVDDIIRDHKDVVNGEGKVIDVCGHEMISTGWTNPSPWKTTREESEEEHEERLERYVSQLKDPKSAIFNFHSPPYQSKLDDAPLLDEELNPILQAGRVEMVPVGSKAVRKMIEKYQPLLGLHGHIHEASGSIRIGRTHCVNPGSEYAEGILRAFLIELKANKIIRLQRIEG